MKLFITTPKIPTTLQSFLGWCALLWIVGVCPLQAWGQFNVSADIGLNENCDGEPCFYDGPEVMINEVILQPADIDGKQVDGSFVGLGAGFNPNTQPGKGEWIELYNPNPCLPIDVSCHFIGNNTQDNDNAGPGINFGASYQIPNGIVIPPLGFLVVRGVNAATVPVANLVANGGNTLEITIDEGDVCMGGGTRFWFRNSGGWVGFFDPTGLIIDAVNWLGSPTLGSRPCVDDSPNCNAPAFLQSYNEAPASKKSYSPYGPPLVVRVPDGAGWVNPAGVPPSIGQCNSTCIPPFVPECTGSIQLTIVGGTPPYTVQWNDAQLRTGTTITGLCAGNFCATITDDNGQQAVHCFDIENAAIEVQVFPPDTLCLGDDPIQINANPLASNSNELGTFFGLGMTGAEFDPNVAGIGTHEIIYHFINEFGCENRDTTEAVVLDTLEISANPDDFLLCPELPVQFDVSGADVYTISPPNGFTFTNPTFFGNGSTSGSYVVTGTRAHFCPNETTITITRTTPIVSMAYESEPISCADEFGSVEITGVTGGTPPYLYNFNNLGFSENTIYLGLAPGSYPVVITDAAGCQYEGEAWVTNTGGLEEFNIAVEDGKCGALAKITVSGASGGTAPYEYSINGVDFSTNPVFEDLTEGTYTITVQDQNGCSSVKNVDVFVFPPLEFNLDSLHQIPCFGLETGAIFTTVDGIGPFDIRWNGDPNLATPDIVNLAAGTYVLALADSLGCDTSISVDLLEPEQFIAQLTTTASKCTPPTGTAEVDLSGGTLPYSIAWQTTPIQTTAQISNLEGGRTYDLEIRDGANCAIDTSVYIETENGPTITLDFVKHLSCANSDDGEMQVSVEGGTPPYVYEWNDSIQTNAPNRTQLKAGPYLCVATDQANCKVSVSAVINQPDSLQGEITVNPDHCDQGIGNLTVSSIGGTGLHTYSWSTNPPQTGSSITVSEGIYQVEIQDENGCSFFVLDTVLNVPGPVIMNVNQQDANCKLSGDGYIEIDAQGQSALTYLWDNNLGSTSNIYNLDPGYYHCTITDEFACQVDTGVTLNFTTPSPEFTIPGPHYFCEGDSVTLNHDGWGDTYEWQPNLESSRTITTKTGGRFILSIWDQGCEGRDTVDVFVDLNPPIDLGQDSLFCAAVSLNLDITVSGNNVQYLWEDGGTNPVRTLVDEGLFWARITRGTCTVEDSVQTTTQPPIAIDLGPDTVLCEGETLLIVPVVNNAFNPQYLWNTGENTMGIQVSQTGNYGLEVWDGPCHAQSNIDVQFIEVPNPDLGEDVLRCLGDTLNLNSGYPNMGNTWSTGAQSEGIQVFQTGVYRVNVDNNGLCFGEDSVEVTFQVPPMLDLGNDTIFCPSNALTLGEENASWSYFWWDTHGSEAIRTVMDSGMYVLTIQEGPCSATDSLHLAHFPEPDIRSLYMDKCSYDTVMVELECSDCVSYLWADGTTSPNRWVPGELETTVYTTNQFNCGSEIKVKVANTDGESCWPLIYVPNAFTPDGDGINDVFIPKISQPELITEYQLWVFDRWGEIIFHTQDMTESWNGNIRGNPVKTDVYAWVIEYEIYVPSPVNRLVGKVTLLH